MSDNFEGCKETRNLDKMIWGYDNYKNNCLSNIHDLDKVNSISDKFINGMINISDLAIKEVEKLNISHKNFVNHYICETEGLLRSFIGVSNYHKLEIEDNKEKLDLYFKSIESLQKFYITITEITGKTININLSKKL